jgi:GT2 family glycosyltransferase
MRIAVIVATLGRRQASEDLVRDLCAQTRLPDRVIFAVTTPEDAPAYNVELGNETLLCDRTGSCTQRNLAIDRIAPNCDIIVFFDDDFIPEANYLERLEVAFEADDAIAGLTGLVVVDGVNGAGLERRPALEAIRRQVERFPSGSQRETQRFGLYGCNMAVRTSALGDRRFDEKMPLYGWLEDLDLTNQLLQEGRLLKLDRLVGAHRGIKAGRTSGVRLGYSQIANAMYLIRKGTAPKRPMYENIVKYLTVNLVRSIRPEPFIDRRGRLKGNLVGLLDILRGKLRPDRILEL